MKTGNVVSGALAGLAIGGIAGILMAPEKGSKTRKQIKDKADDYVGELKTKLDELRDLLAKKIESTKTDAEELADKGKVKLDDAKKDLKNAASDLKDDSTADIKQATSQTFR